MAEGQRVASSLALTSFLVLGIMSTAALAADLSTYRSFQLGTDLATVAKQASVSPDQAKVVHSRPALIQELVWRPQALGWSSKTESVQEVVFSFYKDELFKIVVNYDRYLTTGLTVEDVVEGISSTYGAAEPAVTPPNVRPGRYGGPEEVLARWQDSQYLYDLIRSPYGPGFRLIGVLKSLEALSQTALIEAAGLDDQEAPQREADRIAKEQEAERAKLEKVRLANKPNFRP